MGALTYLHLAPEFTRGHPHQVPDALVMYDTHHARSAQPLL
jgi:hypothetical protein